ncbi:fructosamine kinase family protein [Thalassiella azotivora]
MTDPDAFTKSDPGAPDGFFEVEAAGLRWLAQAADGVPVVGVRDVGPGRIVLDRLTTTAPAPAAADDLGRGLAATHAAGARHHGCPPDGWDGDGFIGTAPLPHDVTGRCGSFGEFYATSRVEPYLRAAVDRGLLPPTLRARLDEVLGALRAGAFDTGEPPSRLHGDLWSGNVVWTPRGAVLVDPAAHGGHRETDLAMLALFGLPHLDRVLAAYDACAPLADGWRERVPVHQLHPLLVHVVLFGGGYVDRLAAVAAACPC